MKRIQLGGHRKGSEIKEYALVDDEDFEWLNRWKWRYSGGYAKRNDNRKSISMHRLIINTPKGMDTDHINLNRLDNRRDNLRICTQSENEANKGMQKNNTSGYKGVQWNNQYKKWIAKINQNKKQIYLGVFSDRFLAAKAYDCKARELFGKFARLNNI